MQFGQGLDRRPGLRETAEKLNHLIRRRLKQIGDTPSSLSQPRLEHVFTIAPSVAIWALDEYIAQELHLDFFKTSPTAIAALTLSGIEAKRPGRQITRLGLRAVGVQFSDVVKRPDVNRGI